MNKQKVTIVGGGPTGALHACYLAKKGFEVDLFEARSDIRNVEVGAGRSINLALSRRGIDSLKGVGLDKEITSLGLPMHSRMIHLANGTCYPVPYGNNKEYLLSISRLKLNQSILNAAVNTPNVNVYFKHKLTSCNLDKPEATFLRKEDNTEIVSSPDCLFGCDGAYSNVRAQMKRGIFDYSQKYIPHSYKELSIPATKDGEFQIEDGHLHIWPRHQYMMIALPNQDRSFTCTLFMPNSVYEPLKNGEEVIKFFKKIFPDALPLIGEKKLVEDFFLLPPLPLITVKCKPYSYKNTAALLGDAAHAVVPFFGQGLNASLEDVLVFNDIMNEYENDFSKVLPKYSDMRYPDGQAVADLSEQNYIEMRSDVASNWFLFRKKVDNFLNKIFPSYFVPKYTMVSFSRIRYHHVILRSRKQDKIVNFVLAGFALLLLITFFAYLLDKIPLNSSLTSEGRTFL